MVKEYLTTTEAMELMGIKSRGTIHNMIKSGKIEAINTSSGKRRTWKISVESVNNLKNEKTIL